MGSMKLYTLASGLAPILARPNLVRQFAKTTAVSSLGGGFLSSEFAHRAILRGVAFICMVSLRLYGLPSIGGSSLMPAKSSLAPFQSGESAMYNKSVVVVLGLFVISGCSTAVTIPVNYSPQNFARYEGRTDIGQFEYAPASAGKVAPNQIQNTAIGSIFIAANIAEVVKRATALELERTGIRLGDGNALAVSGDVLEFKADDRGSSVKWSYSIRYRINRKSDGTELLNKVYIAEPKKTGKFGLPSDYTPSINELILSAYDKFIRDEQARRAFSGSL
jgi:hypothetical protein